MDAEWQSFAMSHDKGACNGDWGNNEKASKKGNSENPYEETMLSRQHYKSAAVNIPSVTSE
jgi:hypothetical protein